MNKRLYKSSSDRVLFGVCGGIADYFDVDPVIISLLTVLFAFTGTGILFYIAAALIMNDAPGYAGGARHYQNANEYPPGPDYSETYTPDSTGADYSQREKQPTPPPRRKNGVLVFGLVLMVIGLFILAGVLFPFLFRISYKAVCAVLLIGLGLYFVLRH